MNCEEKELSKFKEKIKIAMSKNKEGGYKSRPERYKDMIVAYCGLNTIIKGDYIRIKCNFSKPYSVSGYICVTGEDIKITNPEIFSYIIDASSNFEIHTRTDSVIEFSFGFTDLILEDK